MVSYSHLAVKFLTRSLAYLFWTARFVLRRSLPQPHLFLLIWFDFHTLNLVVQLRLAKHLKNTKIKSFSVKYKKSELNAVQCNMILSTQLLGTNTGEMMKHWKKF